MGKKILICEDDEDQLAMISKRMVASGYEVDLAKNGEECLKMYKDSNPDLIILDLLMPVIDGYEVCKQLKANPESASTPIMILTANDVSELETTVLELGANDGLKKPFNSQELLSRVEKLI